MPAATDRNLLFGILAVHLDFATPDELVAGMGAWLRNKSKSLGDILCEQGCLSPGRLQLLTALVDEHLKRHEGNVERSLAALSSAERTAHKLVSELPDGDVRQTLQQVLPASGTPRPAVSPSPVRYRILRPHAKGGLGEVYVAEDTELGRQVALKEIQERFADDDGSRSRFVLEAEITGGLEHPGIVPVYGLGAYADGRPFYAMRFIKGDNLLDAIRRFHDESPNFAALAFRALLRRFVDVCNAIAYAHSRGVLHRDLKPGNIMLGQYGETLVVDWGLAKASLPAGGAGDGANAESSLLTPRSGDSRTPTLMGQAVGTPAYMPPEQSAGRLDEIGPATDVYSLGATLYELLTGRTAFHDAPSVGEVLRRVEAGEFLSPRAVNVAVPRALDAVCIKAMARRPADRYSSALNLATEVERWLADEPVLAYPEPLGARVRRWTRHHARLVTGLAAALLVGLAALGVVLWQSERARAAVEGERDRALAARRRTRTALDAMVSGVTGESLATQKAISPEQKAFLRGVLRYYEEFAAEPGEDREGRERLAAAHVQLGSIRARLGQAQDGVAVYKRAAELYAGLAADFPAVPEYRRDLARSYGRLGNLLDDLGQPAEAEAAHRAALAVRAKLAADFPAVPEYRSDLAHSHNNLGAVLENLNRRTEAEAAYRAALAVRAKLAADFPTSPEYRSVLATSHNNLGLLLQNLSRRTEAETEYRAALAERVRLATDYPTVPEYRSFLADSHNDLGALLYEQGRLTDATSAHRAALTLRAKLAADYPAVPQYRRDTAISHNNLGVLLVDLDKPAEAEAEYRAAVAVQAKLAADLPDVPGYRSELAVSHNNLGELLAGRGRPTEAEVEYRAAVALQAKLAADVPGVPAYRSDLAGSYYNLGLLLAGLDKRADAEAASRAAVNLLEKLAADHPDVLAYREKRDFALLALSGVWVAGGRVADAVAVAGRIADGQPASADMLYYSATIFALASAAANNPNADAHASRAVALLRQAVAKGYRNVQHLLDDSNLAALRRRDDFAVLTWDLADGLPPAPETGP